MNDKRILLLGVGNLLYGDEGVGVHAARKLEATYNFSQNVTLVEGGTLGKLLMPYLVDCDIVIIIDAVLGGHAPGTIYRLEGEGLRQSLGFRDSQHQVDLVDILISCDLIGMRPDAVVVGMEPQDMLTMQMELTDTVKSKFPKFLEHVLEQVQSAGGEFTQKNKPHECPTS